MKVMCRLGVEVQLVQLSAGCEQPDNKNTRNSTLYFTSNRVVALFTGGRSSATLKQTASLSLPQRQTLLPTS